MQTHTSTTTTTTIPKGLPDFAELYTQLQRLPTVAAKKQQQSPQPDEFINLKRLASKALELEEEETRASKKPRLLKESISNNNNKIENVNNSSSTIQQNANSLPIAQQDTIAATAVHVSQDAGDDPIWTCPNCHTKWHERRLLKIDNEPMCASMACEQIVQPSSRKGKNALLNIQPYGICNNGHMYMQCSVRASVKKCPFMDCTATLRQTCYCGESFTLDQKTNHRCAYRKPKRVIKVDDVS